jgi:hypothetical protein
VNSVDGPSVRLGLLFVALLLVLFGPALLAKAVAVGFVGFHLVRAWRSYRAEIQAPGVDQ